LKKEDKMASAKGALTGFAGGARAGAGVGKALGSFLPISGAGGALIGAGVGGLVGALTKSRAKKLREQQQALAAQMPDMTAAQQAYGQAASNVGAQTTASQFALGPQKAAAAMQVAGQGQKEAARTTGDIAKRQISEFYRQRRPELRQLGQERRDAESMERQAAAAIPGAVQGLLEEPEMINYLDQFSDDMAAKRAERAAMGPELTDTMRKMGVKKNQTEMTFEEFSKSLDERFGKMPEIQVETA